jgi:hypothetical protein
MSQERNMKWLHDRRILYARNPITDMPTESTDLYDYYAEGTYQCYSLFRSKAKITTYKSLKWHFLVLYYLNTTKIVDNLLDSELTELFKFIANKGKLIGRGKRIVEDDIYECMLSINNDKKKITIAKLANMLKCTTRTIHRNMGNQLKLEKELLNKQV